MTLLQTDLELTRNSYYAATAPTSAASPCCKAMSTPMWRSSAADWPASAAIELADRGYNVALLEARQVGWGASGRNGGQAIAGLA